MQKTLLSRNKRSREGRVKAVRKQVFKGSFFICPISHKCLYPHSVKTVREKNMRSVSKNVICQGQFLAISFKDQKQRKNIPCQSVHNKLFTDNIAEELKKTNDWKKFQLYKDFYLRKLLLCISKVSFLRSEGVFVTFQQKLRCCIKFCQIKERSERQRPFLFRTSKTICCVYWFKIFEKPKPFKECCVIKFKFVK